LALAFPCCPDEMIMGGPWLGQGEAQSAVKGGGPVIAALDMQRQGLALMRAKMRSF